MPTSTARPLRLPWPRSRLIDVPRDLAAVTAVADDEEGASATGLDERAVEAIWKAVLAWYRSGTQPFISLCVRRRGHVALHRSVGHSHGNGPGEDGPAIVGSPHTPVALFSASKMVTAMLVHALAERDLLALDERVAYYLPEFAACGKERVTLRDLLTHRAGIPTMPGRYQPEQAFDFEDTVARLCAAPGTSSHARRQAYHAVTGGFILGAVAEAVTGEALRPLLQEIFAAPMGLATLGYGIDDARAGEVAVNYATGPDQPGPLAALSRRALGSSWDTVVELSNDRRFLSSTIPAANVVATAGDLASFMQMLLDEGRRRHGGRRVLARKTVAEAVAPVSGAVLDRMLLVPMRYSAGLMLGNSPVGLYGPMCRRAFGHLGFINIFAWADPDRDTAVALLSTGKSLYGTHIASLVGLLSTISWHTYRR